MGSTIFKIASEEGVVNLFRGLTPGLQRQFVNCSVRFGLYEHVRNALCPNLQPGELPPLHKKIMAAAITGSISILFANPMDVVKVRMQSLAREGGKMPSSVNVYKTIYRKENFSGFYRGIQPNIVRNVCVNVGEMASYDQFKQMLLQYTSMKEGTVLHFTAGFMAGFVATIVASPADVVKTRLMSSPDSYTGVVNAFTRMMTEEGPRAFYKGFIPNFMRLSLWSCTCFIAMEKIKVFLQGPPKKE